MDNDCISVAGDVAAPWIMSLDPRVKLVALATVLVAVFSAGQVWRLVVLTLVVLLVSMIGRVSLSRVLGRMYALRWVLMAGFFLHLASGSGRSLWGVPFLSLDGLLKGAVVGWRLLLAVICSSLFCWTTPVPALMAAMVVVMRPVNRIIPVMRIARHGMLVFMWLPLIQDEVLAFKRARKASVCVDPLGVAGWAGEFGNVFDRLILATDTMVDAVLDGDVPVLMEGACAPNPWGYGDLGIFFMTGIFALVWFWWLP